MSDIAILHMSVDENEEDSYFRLLVDGRHFKYISIEANVYAVDDLVFPPSLLSQLPPLPPGDWNLGHITKSPTTTTGPQFAWTTRKSFTGIRHTWHPVRVDYLSLSLGRKLMSNVFEATCSSAAISAQSPVIAKFARFPWETSNYETETEVYSWIAGRGIGPSFLGHITEEGRVIGFLMEKVVGRHAGIEDLEACRIAVKKLHQEGIYHGDLNKHNFLVSSDREICLIDFETARKGKDQQPMDRELSDLEDQLRTTSTRGGTEMI
ncbi:MAG: hypothetical protein M4579_007286 [Chaenotheca gracillima]|nr:MAG: hypothetical protein M4579_007286 [Chaenotheca gracillima]